ncbi:MAG: AAA family ATPase [Bacteroidia bacterium]|nr:AAA family ATPase [Bacteroidia bacterium]
MKKNIHYLVGPNGTGKTRALSKLCEDNRGFYVPKQRTNNVKQFNDSQTKEFTSQFLQYSKTHPDQVAMSLLRDNAKLRYTVFQILSRKLGRNFSLEIIERTQNFKVTSGLDNDFFETVSIPRYDFEGESSGLRELLIILTFINSGLSKKYFIDEPELSLHPEAQRFLKNEMLRLIKEKNIEFWLATHSPIFFAPESIEELEQATFFSDPQVLGGTKPDFTTLTPGQKIHLEKSLLRLDSEKWLLVHSKGVVFCEGFRDKVIFKKVLEKCDIDISRNDFSIVETGGKDDFSTLHLLCQAIAKPSFYIGDLDCLIESKLLDKFNNHPIVIKELSAIATNIQDYVSKNIRDNLGNLLEELIKVDDAHFKTTDSGNNIYPHLYRIKKKTDNSKSLTLELINKYPALTKAILQNSKLDPVIDLLVDSTSFSISILSKAGFFIIPTGSLETFYQSTPVSPDDDKEKIKLFDIEYELLKTEDRADVEKRYATLLAFIQSIIFDTFDNTKFMRSEIIKVLAKIQSIILEERPASTEALSKISKYQELKIDQLFSLKTLDWNKSTFKLTIESSVDFLPAFEVSLSSDQGITTDDIVKFK